MHYSLAKTLSCLLVLTACASLSAEDRLLVGKGASFQGGSYFAISETGGDVSSFSAPVPFAKGALTAKGAVREWEAPSAYLILDFGRPVHVSKIKMRAPVDVRRGTEKLSVSYWNDVKAAFDADASFEGGVFQATKLERDLAPEFVRPSLERPLVEGVNEITLDATTNILLLKFDVMRWKKAIAISDFEIWGGDPSDASVAEACAKFAATLKEVAAKDAAMRERLERLPNFAFSGAGAKAWTNLLSWPGSKGHQVSCVLSQRDGSLSKDAAWAGDVNYWAAPAPAMGEGGDNAPQVLVVTLTSPKDISVFRLVFCSKNNHAKDFTLEFSCGGKWRTLFHDKSNSAMIATYQFKTVKTDKLRLTMHDFDGLEHRLLMRSFQVYDIEGAIR